eukprot:7391949-Prymnesium_polylepis.1
MHPSSRKYISLMTSPCVHTTSSGRNVTFLITEQIALSAAMSTPRKVGARRNVRKWMSCSTSFCRLIGRLPRTFFSFEWLCCERAKWRLTCFRTSLETLLRFKYACTGGPQHMCGKRISQSDRCLDRWTQCAKRCGVYCGASLSPRHQKAACGTPRAAHSIGSSWS